MTRRLAERIALAATLALVLGHYLWTISSNGRPLDLHAASTEYYNRLADALLAGRVSLRPDPDPALLALSNPYGAANQPFRVANVTQDLSLYGGRYYLYFGIAPALVLFVPFRLLTGLSLPQSLAAALLLFGAVVWASLALLLLRRTLTPRAPSLITWLAVVTLGFGNFGPFVLRRPAAYELAAAAAAFFSSAAAFWLVKALLDDRHRVFALAAGSTAVGFAIASRPTEVFLLGALGLTALLLRLRPRGHRAELAALAVPALVCVLAVAAYNQARFEAPWEFGMHYVLSDWDIRAGKMVSLAFVPYNLAANFLALPRFDVEFPFVHVAPILPVHAPAGYMLLETRAGLFACTPLAVLALIWPFAWRRPRTEPLVRAGLLLTGSSLLVALALTLFGASTTRYTLDFSMPLLVSAGAAWMWLDARLRPRPRARLVLDLFCTAAVVYATVVNLAIGLTGLYDWLRRGEPATYDRVESLFTPVQRAALALRSHRYGDAVLTVRLPAGRDGATEVLLAAGALFRHNALCIRYVEGERVSLRFEHRGFPALRSAPIAAPRSEPHTVEVAMGSLYPLSARALARVDPALAAQGVDRLLRVRFDGQDVLAGTFDFVPSAPPAVVFGHDPWGNGICSEPFHGTIERVERRFPP